MSRKPKAVLSPPVPVLTLEWGARPEVRGKFFWRGDKKFYLRGVTYGPFRPGEDGSEYHIPAIVAKDFSMMTAAGVNSVRVYTVPPRWLLDMAAEYGLLVMVGLPWEQHITFLDDRNRVRQIEQRVREGVRSLSGHPALLGVAVGNEIPASIVRWHGWKRVKRFVHRLYETAKSEDPGALVTYVNFPTTEYLELDFLDFSSFNVYLESEERLEAYLGRLQNLAGSRPLVMAEIGLDSLRNGLSKQAATLDWQVRRTFASGAAGAFVFAWTDEWYRGGHEIEDWDFGLTTRSREPKPALAAMQRAFDQVPVAVEADWPKISVVVCSRNGEQTIRDTLDHQAVLEYPNFETIVVSDGSTDQTADIARGYAGVRVIETRNRGLSAARNLGMRAATGEIVAYIDDDAYPDPHWLHYLALAFQSTKHAAIGGPNLPPLEDGPIAECIAKAPGGPIHVLVGDDLAEHIPGCNFAVRKSALEAINGFDPIFRAAGDDVDVCWRLQERGFTIGFHPAAIVWHHRRNSLRTYWCQQRGYGEAEALLERKWPAKYNAEGHLSWTGRLYGDGVLRSFGLVHRVYHGVWNNAPFQRLYQPAAPLWQTLPQTPDWYLVNLMLGLLCVLGFSWRPLFLLVPLVALGVALPLLQIGTTVRHTRFSRPGLRALTASLFIIQPMARLWGRFEHGLTPLRRRVSSTRVMLHSFQCTTWSETWRSAGDWLNMVYSNLESLGAIVAAGGDCDRWEIEVRGGLFGAARVRLAVEEHGSGKQLLRWYAWPRVSRRFVTILAALATLAWGAAGGRGWTAASVLSICAVLMSVRAASEWGCGLGSIRSSIDGLEERARSVSAREAIPPQPVRAEVLRRETG